jgi:hypothetical protein
MTSSSYLVRQATLDVAGGVSGSAHYRLVSSVGALGGLARSSDGAFADRQGFAGSLNDPPRATADTVRRPVGQAVKVRITSLFANDRDPEADPVALLRFDALTAAGGRVTLDNGWLLYEPPLAFPGTDTFTYSVEDAAGNVAPALVTVLVAGTGPAPSDNLVAITLLPNGHKRITFAGIARRRYEIQWADSLPATAWQMLATVDADARGIIEWVDPTEPAPAERYYRTVAQ